MEIVIRAAVVYVLLWGLLRAMGKRELAEVTAFELVLLVVLGDIVQQGVTQEDMSVTGALLAAGTMALLAVGSSLLAQRIPRSRSLLEGRPSVVVRDGAVIDATVRALRMTDDEIHEAARKRGYASLGDLAWVIVESDGKFSFIEAGRASDPSGAPEEQGEDGAGEEGGTS
ncbi:MAG: DUF421 domain-containing protein [Acidimicrobiales bacterium]